MSRAGATQSGLGLAEVLAGTGGVVAAEESERVAAGISFAGVSIDSRTLRPGDLFFAIAGERFDGHDFLAAVAAAGAAGAVVAAAQLERVRAATPGGGMTLIAVDDPRLALARLAAAHRAALELRVVGVTGSNGKTTTKELLAAALEAMAPGAVLRTEGNLNNDLGVPLTLLRLRPGQHHFAVIEMGMSARGEIAGLARLAAPVVGVVTGVAPAHLEHLGTLDEIAAAKGELFAALPAEGIAIYPDDDERLAAQAAAHLPRRQHRTFGNSEAASVRILESRPLGAAGSEVVLGCGTARLSFRLAFVGSHNVRNAAAAAAAALAVGATPEAVAAGLAAARPTAGRSHLERVGGRLLLDDCYNANPGSMRAALELVAALRPDIAAAAAAARTVVVLGDMLELGPEGPRLHAEIGEHAARLGVDQMILIGKLAREIGRGARAAGMPASHILETEDRVQAAAAAAAATGEGDILLIKASHGMHLEQVVEMLRHHLEETR